MINVRQTFEYNASPELFFIKLLMYMINQSPDIIEGDALDLGANLGFYSVFLSAKYKQVTGLEPNSSNFDKLLKLPNTYCVEYLKKAIADYDGFISLVLSENNTNHSTMPGLVGKNVECVECVTLNTLCKDKNVQFIKCDVEGGEAFIFDEVCAGEALRKTHPIIAYEAHENIDLNRIYGNLCSFGYNQFYCEHGQFTFLNTKHAKHYLIGKDSELLTNYMEWYNTEGKNMSEQEYTLNIKLK